MLVFVVVIIDVFIVAVVVVVIIDVFIVVVVAVIVVAIHIVFIYKSINVHPTLLVSNVEFV